MALRGTPHLPSRVSLTHGLMVVAGLLTFVGVGSVLRDRSATIEVLVATAPIERGATLRAEDLTEVSVRANDPIVAHFLRSGAVVEGQAARPIAPGEPVLRTDVVPIQSGQGARTFSIAVDERVISGLDLRPGDRVDVVGFEPDGRVDLLAVDLEVTRLSQTGSSSGLGASFGPSFLTFQVTSQQALRLVAALRVDDVEIVRSTGAPASPMRPDLLPTSQGRES